MNIMTISDLEVHYPARVSLMGIRVAKTLKAVDGVSLALARGEILGLVGESGCGKTSLGRAIIRLVEPARGRVEIEGVNFLSLEGNRLRRARPQIQMIFQDPYASLDPRMTVYDILSEPLRAHQSITATQMGERVVRALELVGLSTEALRRYPHEFSAGQRQRVAIARALILDPKVIIADEPLSSLDVSVQAQILNLLKEVRANLGLSMIFISHNLAVVKYISDRIAVMYMGKIVEIARRDELFASPRHPYTQALVSAVPIPDPHLERLRKRVPLVGEPPSLLSPPSGCAFHTRCPLATAHCHCETPILEPTTASATHRVSCWNVK